jgi:hypothetical protein
MSDQTRTAVGVAARLRETLNGVGDALAYARLDELLSLESQLVSALGEMASVRPDPDARRALVAELDEIRAALLRCRRLGASLHEFERTVFESHGSGCSYDRTGLDRPSGRAGVLNARG